MINDNKSLNVLSIDFDFFQNVSLHTLRNCYPDGIDLSTQMSSIIWQTKYSEHKNELRDVHINTALLSEAIYILNNQESNIPVLITNSHVKAYYFIKDISSGRKVRLINVDMHHDLFNDNPEVDCGNWISHLKSEIPLSIKWIARHTSSEMYQFDDEINKLSNLTFDLKSILKSKFDAVFICRSDPWTPPHLDCEFLKLIYEGCSHFINLKSEPQVLSVRNYAA